MVFRAGHKPAAAEAPLISSAAAGKISQQDIIARYYSKIPQQDITAGCAWPGATRTQNRTKLMQQEVWHVSKKFVTM